MPRTCTIGLHVERETIEPALITGQLFRSVAARVGASATALCRQKQDHTRRPPCLPERRHQASIAHVLVIPRALQQGRLARALGHAPALRGTEADTHGTTPLPYRVGEIETTLAQHSTDGPSTPRDNPCVIQGLGL
jgi:hypothetical protein